MHGHSLARVTAGNPGRSRVSTTHLSPENRILPPLPDSYDQCIQFTRNTGFSLARFSPCLLRIEPSVKIGFRERLPPA